MISSFMWFVAIALILSLLFILLSLFALGAMHQHLHNIGKPFGKDEELHSKVDYLKGKIDAAFPTDD